MLSPKEVSEIFDLLLSPKWMNDEVKIVLRVPRKQILLLVRAIELGLTQKESDGLFNVMETVTAEGIRKITEEILEMAELSGTYTKMNSLQKK